MLHTQSVNAFPNKIFIHSIFSSLLNKHFILFKKEIIVYKYLK